MAEILASAPIEKNARGTEPVFFGVIRRNGVESPRLFYDIVPSELLRKNSPLIYCTRLDTMPSGDRLITESLDRLFVVWLHLRKVNKLPPEDRGKKPKAEALNNA